MPLSERRSGHDRRSTVRYPVEVDIEWEGGSGRLSGAISDVSLEGCFVLCSGNVNDGDSVKVFVPLADGMKVEFAGRVTNHVVDIGFGLEFDQLSASQRDLLIKIVRKSEQS